MIMKPLERNQFFILLVMFIVLGKISAQTACTLTNCATCDATGTTCSVCSNGYMLDATNNCLQCLASCGTCSTSTTFCDTCANTAITPSSGVCSATSCDTALNYYFDGQTSSCLLCDQIIPTCKICSQYSPTATICLSCLAGSYLDRSLVLCLPCPNGCVYCNNGATCGSCYPGLIYSSSLCFCTIPGQMYDSTLGKCVSCTLGCLKCSGMTTCSTCDTTNGWMLSGTTCINCNSMCTNCGPTGCITCQPGYQPVGGVCKTCSLTLPNPGCLQCTPVQCSTCLSIGYFMNTTTSLCQRITCNSSQTIIAGVCKACSTLYDIQCTQCNTTTCIFCTNGYVYNTTTFKCELRRVFGCGDGFWIDTVEGCDDWNFVNGDGCDANCQPETDYTCLVADKQPIGTSLCKYQKDFTISLDYLQKDPYSNTGHLFFTIEPSGFLQWTSQAIQDLLTPLMITDLSTGSVVSVSYNQISFIFQRVDEANKFEMIIDYDQQSLENTFVQISINSSQTSLPSINTKPTKAASFVQLNSQGNGVPLYFYTQEIYDLQKSLQSLCMFIGYLSVIFVFVGFIVPAGKLIVVEALAVIQISFFSVLQFKNIPPTYIGFKELTFSSGYNIPSIIETSTINFEQSTFGLMGFGDNILSNYNISFILLFLVPAILSIVGFLISRHILKKSLEANADIKEILMEIDKGQAVATNTEEQVFNKLRANLFKRILFEVSFYGLLITGYLAWVSILKSFSSFSIFSLIYSILILAIWVAYGIVFFKTKTGTFSLNQQSLSKSEENSVQNLSILRFFGEFREVYQQISKKDDLKNHPLEKVYLIFMVERILISVMIALLSSVFSFVGVLILIFYLFLFLGLIFCHRRLQSVKEEERKGLFSHFYQNYTLRQSVNFITIIIVQLIFVIQQACYESSTLEEAMATNSFTTKMAPIVILSLVLINLLFNIFLWVWEVKHNQLLRKSQLVIKIMMYSKPQEKGQDKMKMKGPYVKMKQGQVYLDPNEEHENLRPKKRRQEDIDEIIKAHNSGVGSSGRSPFMGVQQKSSGYKRVSVGESYQNSRLQKIGEEPPEGEI